MAVIKAANTDVNEEESMSGAFRFTGDLDPMGHPPGGLMDVNGYTGRRCFSWGTGANLMTRVAPTAGGTIDGVSAGANSSGGYVACPGVPVQVEASAAFSLGADLETLADGRVKTVATGKAVLRALEASAGAGSIVWCCFKSGI
jgi:hypothetical protein